jgi:dinuclear metal center YbgI/SA1388 family protein
MTQLQTLVNYTNNLLNIEQFNDYCPNGLQVQAESEFKKLLGGVTASRDLVEAACDCQANAILVHHGYFWKGENPTLTGMKYERISRLIQADIALLAYHLPLDAHPLYGNNAQLGKLFGIEIDGWFANVGGADIACYGQLEQPLSCTDFATFLHNKLGRAPLSIQGHEREIRRIGWCSGAAQGYLEEAAALNLDAYVSGEVSEHTYHAARELGINYFAAGHHATERHGVMALGSHLADHFNIEFEFLDLQNPV